MSAFTEHFLREDAASSGWLRRLVGGGARARAPRVLLGAFGKHPGWDDHLDDIGIQTETLALAKQLLYVEGIGGQLNAGAWDALPEEKRLPGFAHVFLWRRGGQALAGRLWSSVDRKGRGRYPMVVCAEADGRPLPWTLARVLPGLASVEAACRATDSADEVRAIIESARQELEAQAAAAAAGPDAPAFAWPAEWRNEGEAALRVLYRVRSQLSDYAPGHQGGRAAREMRLSLSPGAEPAGTLQAWAGAFDALLDPSAPTLFLLPLECGWLDVIVGEPVSESFFALRAGAEAIAPTDQVPYTLDPLWSAQAGAFLARLRMGDGVNVHSAKEFWRLPAA